jgi:molybdopterin converting factor small subunit
MAIVIIPTPLRKFTNSSAMLEVSSGKVSDVIDELTINYPELKKHLLDPDGKIPSFINIFVNDEDIRNLQNGQTEVMKNAIISIVPAIAGGVD